MLSTLTIVGIFTEIFAGGILVAGFFAFLKKFFLEKEKKDLALSFLFLTFSLFLGLMLASQLIYNIGGQISTLITLQKLISISLIFGSLFVFIFIKEKFKVPHSSPLIIIYTGTCFYLSYRILRSFAELIYRPEVIEPVVNFSNSTPSRSLWILSWLVLFVFSLVAFSRQKGPAKFLIFYDLLASFFIFSSYISTILYTGYQNSYFLLISWVLTLFGVFSLTLGEIIPQNSPLAKNPLDFLRSRILFKLVFIFVLLIVILFEVTTLATLTLSKQALKASILQSYKDSAKSLATDIENSPIRSTAEMQKILKDKKIGRGGVAYIVDGSGTVIAHSDKSQIGTHKNISGLQKKSGQLPPDAFGDIKVGASYPVKKVNGFLVIEEPISLAYYEMRRLETNSLIFVIVGIALTVFTGLILAQSIERPIKKLTKGTAAVSKGNLNYKIDIDSIDEIGNLAETFNAMTHDLKDSQERLILSEKLASLGTMAAGMAHEIKNPLVSLRTFSQLIQQKWDDPNFRTKFAQIVPTEIERINKIAESLLKFGRPMKPELSRVSVNSILDEILVLFESECKKNGIRVTTKLAQVPDIKGDMQQLSQAFVNIIINGIQAMEKGGELTVKTDFGEVVHVGKPLKGDLSADGSITWENEDAHKSSESVKSVFIEVTDTGPGISPENLKALFDPFFTTKAKGTGMGLPITLRIIEEHKGSIKVKSEIGKGTSFIIILPQNAD